MVDLECGISLKNFTVLEFTVLVPKLTEYEVLWSGFSRIGLKYSIKSTEWVLDVIERVVLELVRKCFRQIIRMFWKYFINVLNVVQPVFYNITFQNVPKPS